MVTDEKLSLTLNTKKEKENEQQNRTETLAATHTNTCSTYNKMKGKTAAQGKLMGLGYYWVPKSHVE